MSDTNYIEVTDKGGWRKLFALRKSIVYIGSDDGNDIVLEPSHGEGVASRHLQLVVTQDSSSPFRAVNVGDAGIVLRNAGDQILLPRSVAAIGDGEQLQLGDFVLDFHLSGESLVRSPTAGQLPQTRPPRLGLGPTADPIGLRISLPGTRLNPGTPLEGVVTVCNLGQASSAQFHLELEGLDPDHYELGAGPILYPQAEKAVHLFLHHPCQPQPPAGWHTIQVHATAPAAYPGVRVTVVRQIEIQPFYRHTVGLVMRS